MKRDMEDILLDLIDGDIDIDKAKEELLFLNIVSERTEAKTRLDDEFTHYEPTMCDGIATMRECENGTYIERDDAHLIIDKYVR